jgi:Tol biopolymer transport system component
LLQSLDRWEALVPVWSPDGQWLAFSVEQQLCRVSRDGRRREVLARLPAWQGWTVRWSPEGSHLAALGYARAEDQKQNPAVFVVSPQDRQLRRLTPESEDRYKEGLEWHPEGDRLVYFYYGPERFSAKNIVDI